MQNNLHKLIFLFFSTIFLTACAGIDVQRDTVNPYGHKGSFDSFWYGLTYSFQPQGIRYLQPDNFIYVYSDKYGKVTAQHIILPATDKKLSAQPYSYFADLNFLSDTGEAGLFFKDGMLLSTKFSANEAAIPAAIITAAGSLAQSAVEAGVAGAGAFFDLQKTPTSMPSFYVFRLKSTNDGFKLIGKNGYSVPVN